jgi:two-component system, NarL family, response regulator NreC
LVSGKKRCGVVKKVYVAHSGELSLIGLTTIVRESCRYECVGGSHDGYVAVREVVEIEPDIIVLGQHLEGMNGMCTAREILRERGDAKIIGVVNRVCAEAVVGFLEAGVRVVLCEEECVEGFGAAVRRVEGRRPFVGQLVTRHLTDLGVSETLIRYGQVRRLSQREMQVLQLIVEGRNTRETADRLCVSVKTVETHRARIMEKLGIRSVAGLTKYAIEAGLTQTAVY